MCTRSAAPILRVSATSLTYLSKCARLATSPTRPGLSFSPCESFPANARSHTLYCARA